MKKNFVMLDVFNKAYEDLGWVDFYKITKITDASVSLVIYTKKEISKEDDEFDTLVMRNIDIGEKIGREIIWDYVPTSKNHLVNWFRRFIIKNKENKH